MNFPSIEQKDLLPISMLNQLEYCERRFYLMYVLGEMDTNSHVLEGTFLHEITHTAGIEKEGDNFIHRNIYLWSEELGIVGFADVIEENNGQFTPIEYKKGRMGRWLNDHIQLCAQAICIYEHTRKPILKGYIFYFESRRREEVLITEELCSLTRKTVDRARDILRKGIIPDPLSRYEKCRDCSLETICLPRETRQLKRLP